MHQILLVDDDADVRRLVKKILEKGGYSVTVVDNGLAALDEVNRVTFDLLLSDASMPHYSGFDLIRSIRRLPKHDDLLIAMLTGRRGKEDIELAIQLGVKDYIIKPIDPEVLLTKVEKILESRKPAVNVINYTETAAVDFEASLQSPIRMATIGLSGFTAYSSVPIAFGTEFYLSIDALAYGKLPKVKITSSQADPHHPKRYILEGLFLEIDEKLKNEIRNCIKQNRAS